MLKKIYKWFGFIVITKQVFTFQLPFFKMPLLGKDLNTYLYYLFLFFSLFALIFKCLDRKKRNKNDVFLMIYLLWSSFISIFYFSNLNSFLSDFTLFFTPIAVYSWFKYCSPSLRECINWFSIVGMLMALFSIIIATGILDVGIWAAEGDYVRAAGAISSSAAIGCLIGLFAYILFDKSKKTFIQLFFHLLGFLGSIITIIFSFSRTRWVISFFIIILMILMYIFSKAKKKSKFGFAFLLLLVLSSLYIFVSTDVFNKIFEQMFLRFDLSVFDDHSITYRIEEMSNQLSYFFQSVLLGNGWGPISQNEMYVHNIFTATMMQAGLFSIFYFLWYFSFAGTLLKFIKNKKNMFILTASLFIQIVLLVLGVTNGGFLVSGGYFSFILVIACDAEMKKIMSNEKAIKWR